ncbi:MAG TPA: GNAT family N-acetyltransferase [Candidatus Dormibacteraeota bacterium]|nr:GNAT family N-acetyltransferase [Candidatus Dormibacteraeota bacterium]
MKRERSCHGGAFQPASDPTAIDRVRQYLIAQGWAGLFAGEHLKRLEATGVKADAVLWWVPGRAGEARAVALLHDGRLEVLMSSSDEGAAALELLQANRSALQWISLREGAVAYPGLDEFTLYRRELAVAPQIRMPECSLPRTRPARPEDAEQLYWVYDSVSWMRQDTPQAWRERLAEQRCWVAELEGQVVAAARWTMSFGQWVEVGGVATHPEFRRRAAGSAVTLAAASAALTEGKQVALRYSDPALAILYHALGFEHVGRELVFHRKG